MLDADSVEESPAEHVAEVVVEHVAEHEPEDSIVVEESPAEPEVAESEPVVEAEVVG